MIRPLSHSAVQMFERDRKEFYLNYVASDRLGRDSQSQAAAIGSAFDARVKSELAGDLYGRAPDNLQYEALFTKQVDPAHQQWARPAAEYVFTNYFVSGRYTELRDHLVTSHDVQFENKETTTIADKVVVIGYPDLSFRLPSGQRVVLDWKVKGFCSKHPRSPSKLHVICRDGLVPEGAKPSRTDGKPHKLCKPIDVDGMTIHDGYMEHADETHADQLALYLWLLDEPIGSEQHVVIIDEILAKPRPGEYPTLRIATLAARVSAAYQQQLVDRFCACYDTIASGHIFSDVSREESDIRCRDLELTAKSCAIALAGGDSEEAEFLRSQFNFF
jgi:hypothetical protein